MTATPGKIVFLIAATVAGMQVLAALASAVWTAIRYDQTPPIVIHSASLLGDILRPGESLRYTMTYTKRADCHPPDGKGMLRYRILHLDADPDPHRGARAMWLDEEVESVAGPGVRVTLDGYSTVPLSPPLSPGRYALQWVGTYTCLKSQGPIEVPGPQLPFTVTR